MCEMTLFYSISVDYYRFMGRFSELLILKDKRDECLIYTLAWVQLALYCEVNRYNFVFLEI
jgi:hypothetical protein